MAQLSPPLTKKDSFGNSLVLLESGQIGPYKDSRWSGTVIVERETLNHKDMVKSLVESVVQHGHIFDVGVPCVFATPYFIKLEQVEGDPHLWAFVVMRDYLD